MRSNFGGTAPSRGADCSESGPCDATDNAGFDISSASNKATNKARCCSGQNFGTDCTQYPGVCSGRKAYGDNRGQVLLYRVGDVLDALDHIVGDFVNFLPDLAPGLPQRPIAAGVVVPERVVVDVGIAVYLP
jgi:hypothetical protein